MPFKTFMNWLFDGDKISPIPKPTESTPDILKYNSPIEHTFILRMFIKNGKLNHYLNKYFNNINVRYLDREELFKFTKKCVIDYRVTRRSIPFYKRKYKNKLFDELRKRLPTMKNSDIQLLCEIINDAEEKDEILRSLGLEKDSKKRKVRKKKAKKEKKNISLNEFLKENFAYIEV